MIARVVLAASLLVFVPVAPAGAQSCVARDGLPDSSCTPGDRDPRVNAGNVDQTICVKGYTKSVRPAKSVTDVIKRERMAAYGIDAPMNTYELDHLIPLELGGSSSVANLWPQPWDGALGAHAKDRLEDRLRTLVCDGRMTLDAAQTVFATDWVSTYKQAFG